VTGVTDDVAESAASFEERLGSGTVVAFGIRRTGPAVSEPATLDAKGVDYA
jgi:hypothetical protein